jgi:hypothetical protein
MTSMSARPAVQRRISIVHREKSEEHQEEGRREDGERGEELGEATSSKPRGHPSRREDGEPVRDRARQSDRRERIAQKSQLYSQERGSERRVIHVSEVEVFRASDVVQFVDEVPVAEVLSDKSRDQRDRHRDRRQNAKKLPLEARWQAAVTLSPIHC